MDDFWLAGIDGCPSGWIAALVRPAGPAFDLRVVPRLADLFAGPVRPILAAVDIPIGLPARIGPRGRGPESAVRGLLGARQSSVFAVPSRAAIYTDGFRAACAVAAQTSTPPRMMSKQLFHIAPKIREVDLLLRADPGLAARVFEVHPEVAFWRLNGERALAEPKKVKGRPYGPGLAQRRGLLLAGGVPAASLDARPPAGAGEDDLLDALACALVARRLHAGQARPFPDPPLVDPHGLAMAIWA